MKIEDLQGKRIGILGYGVEGQGLATFLSKHDIAYAIFDESPESFLLDDHKGADFFSGESVLEEIKKCEVVFRSPGIPLKNKAVEAARNNGAVISSQIQLFLENSPAKVIGITGTKGKSTTSKLIFEILKAAGKSVYLGGNFGSAVISLLDDLKAEDYVILELSSFQLQDLKISPHISVVLAVYSDHLDYHSDINEYWQAKSSITKYQSSSDFAIINFDAENSKAIGAMGDAKKFYIHSRYDSTEEQQIQDGFIADKASGNLILVEGGKENIYLESEKVPLRGFHNLQNIGSAVLVARILGISDEIVYSALNSYKGLEHRLEFVLEKDGVKFYNDSISTTPESSLAAIASFEEPKIVILGGSDKGSNYIQFGKEVAAQENVKAVVVLGEIGEKIAQGLKEGNFKGQILTEINSMKEVFQKLKGIVSDGDVVVLAPGAASFGMFKNYKDRGDQFKEEAKSF